MRKRQSLTLAVLLGGLLLAMPLIVHAGGTIKGKVTYSGKPMPPKEFAFSKFTIQTSVNKIPAKKATIPVC